MKRPDLNNIPLDVRIYIQYLEDLVHQANSPKEPQEIVEAPEKKIEERNLVPELESDANIISITKYGISRKTARYLYSRQHRGGFGITDVEVDPPDHLQSICTASNQQSVLLFTNFAKVYRVNASLVSPAGLKEKGNYISDKIFLEPGESFVALLTEQAKGYIALLGETGKVRCLRHHLFGEHLKQGAAMFNPGEFGPLSAVTWTPGDADLLVVSRHGIAIRFSEKAISPQGDLAIRLAPGDKAAGITFVYNDTSVFLIGSDGKGTIRKMSGFSPNKSPGGSGKIAIKNDDVVGATSVEIDDEIFVMTKTGNVIRFYVSEIPETEGVVQGVNCIMMRADRVTGMMRLSPSFG